MIAARPDHPYALLGAERGRRRRCSWFADRVAAGPLPGYAYVGGLGAQPAAPDRDGRAAAVGARPETMAAGDGARALGASAIVGRPSLRDFHPSAVRRQPAGRGIDARGGRACELRLERADMSPLGIARNFDDPAWRAQFCARAARRAARPRSTSGCRRCSGCATRSGVWPTSSTGSGARCSRSRRCRRRSPACACYEILRIGPARAPAGGWCSAPRSSSHERDGERVTSVATRAGRSRLTYARRLVRARQRAASPRGRSSSTRTGSRTSACSACRCAACPAAGAPRFVAEYLAEQPIAARRRRGRRRPARRAGPTNVLVAGASLPGAMPWREGSGEGIALATGYRAAQLVLARPREPQEGGGVMTDRLELASCCAGRWTTASSARSARPSARCRT